MLPKYTFLFDTVDDEPVSDGVDLIPYALSLKSHIHPRDHFHIAISPRTVYVAQYVYHRVTCRGPTWQQSSGLPLGDLCGLFRVFANHDQLNQNINVDARLLRVPSGPQQMHGVEADIHNKRIYMGDHDRNCRCSLHCTCRECSEFLYAVWRKGSRELLLLLQHNSV